MWACSNLPLDAGITFDLTPGCKLAFRDLMTCNRRTGGGRVRMSRGYEVAEIAVLQLYDFPINMLIYQLRSKLCISSQSAKPFNYNRALLANHTMSSGLSQCCVSGHIHAVSAIPTRPCVMFTLTDSALRFPHICREPLKVLGKILAV